MNGKPWLPEHSMLLGTMPDRAVAARTGHCEDTVQRRRAMLGISPFRPKRPYIVPLSVRLMAKYRKMQPCRDGETGQ